MRPSFLPAALLAAVTAALCPVATFAQDAADPAGQGSVAGRLTSALAYRVDGPEELSERDLLFDLEASYEWAGGWSVRALGRARFEDRLEPDERRELDLRELVLTRRTPDSTLQIGRQQVVWGKADGLRLLDVVNPLDLRELILDDYTDRRIPLWMVNAELFRGDQSLQVLVIPDLAFDRLPAPGGEFFPPDLLPPASETPVTVDALDRPGQSPRNWEYGLKWGTLRGRADLTFNALYGWNNAPVPELRAGAGGLELKPRAARGRLLGLSGDLPLGPAVLRFESTYTPDDPREIATPDGLGSFTRQRVWRGVVGVDWIKDNWLISPQWFEERVISPDPRLTGRERQTYLTLLVRRSFRQDRLTVQGFVAYGVDPRDLWLSPRVSHRFFGRLELTLGADLLDGDPDGLFGAFPQRDRVTLETTLRF